MILGKRLAASAGGRRLPSIMSPGAGVRQVSSADAIPGARGPVSPTPAAVVTHRPLAGQAARLGPGLLHDWQQRNRTSSLPLALRQLEAAGNLGNLRLAIAGAREG